REEDILQELATYNGLLGGEGELAATLLIEVEDPALRAARLEEWYALPERVYALLEDGRRVRPVFDEEQRGRGRLSSVQYLKFPVGGSVPVAIGIDLPGIEAETRLGPEQRAALAEDLADSGAAERPARPSAPKA
ncbi:MAG: DUF3501 family protein, partial [Candidatus Rokuibacteriota bacterium]